MYTENKPHLQSLATKISQLSIRKVDDYFFSLATQKPNVLTDQISKFESLDAWEVSLDVFAFFDVRWGRGSYDFDLFASHSHVKCKTFYSKEPCTGSNGTNAFRFNWAGNNNWIVPSISLFAKAIDKPCSCMSIKWNCFYSQMKKCWFLTAISG